MEQICNELFARLRTSLDYLIFEILTEHSEAAFSRHDIASWFNKMSTPSPATFAVHHVLLEVALNKRWDEAAQALRYVEAIMAQAQTYKAEVRVLSFSLTSLTDIELSVLKFAFRDDIGYLESLIGAPNETNKQAAEQIKATLAVLERAAPLWHQELLLMANQFFLASPLEKSSPTFGGATVFDAFGSVLLNPYLLTSIPKTLLSLVHESSHQQMFLFHLDDPILLNPPEATFDSPLRLEARPMEGIFHALWVSARESLAAEQVLTTCADYAWCDTLHLAQKRSISVFEDLAVTVQKHAEFTDFGAVLFTQVQDAMNELDR